MEIESLILLFTGFFVVAMIYSSVGLGGGSSYLALLSLFAFSFYFIRTNALLSNLAVVSGSAYVFYKNGHFNLKEFLPFIISSIPAAFIGALFKLEERVFFIILGTGLILSAISLFYQALNKKSNTKVYPKNVSYLLGGAIGFLSGLVGIGGGIFLAPLLNHLRWGEPIKIAALASFFILVNSLSGLAGLMVRGTVEISWSTTLLLIVAVVLGGQLGVRMSIKKTSPNAIRIATAILVLFVGCRVLILKGILV